MKIIIAACTLLALLATPAYAGKAKPNYPLTTYERDLLEHSALPLILVEVKSIAQQPWTNGNPPQPTLKIMRMIRGGKHPFTLNAVWRPFPIDTSWAGADEQAVLKKWQDKPMDAPAVNSKWMVMGELKGDKFYVSPVARFPSDKEAFVAINNMYENLMPPRNPLDPEMVIAEAARDMRIGAWSMEMAKADVMSLEKSSLLIAEVSIHELQAKGRIVQFTVVTPVKPKAATETKTIKLMWLPDELFSVLYDYTKSKARSAPTFLVFMNTKEVKDSNGEVVKTYAPVDPLYSIIPATENTLKVLGIQKHTQ